MKKLVFVFACFLFSGLLTAQTLNKGSVLGFHIFDQYELKPNVTTEQLEEFMITKFIPAYNEAFEGITMIAAKGERGEHENTLGIIYYMESKNVRDKYWAEEGVLTELGQKSAAKLLPVQQEFSKLATSTGDTYTDWIIK